MPARSRCRTRRLIADDLHDQRQAIHRRPCEWCRRCAIDRARPAVDEGADDMISDSGSLRYSLRGAAVLFSAAIAIASGGVGPAQSRIKVLLVTGQSNRYHNWEVSSPIVRRLLEESGRLAVTVATTPPKGAAPNQDMSSFAPKFSD